jgi:selenocysteine lyase/cysteine desulfurase
MDSDGPLDWSAQWDLRPGVTYLNHGSFGPPPRPVKAARHVWQEKLDRQPMDFFMREYEDAWDGARDCLAGFVGSNERNLAFVENATAAMNVVAGSIRLEADDEVVLTDHEHAIEVPIVRWNDRRWIRVSCHPWFTNLTHQTTYRCYHESKWRCPTKQAGISSQSSRRLLCLG